MNFRFLTDINFKCFKNILQFEIDCTIYKVIEDKNVTHISVPSCIIMLRKIPYMLQRMQD